MYDSLCGQALLHNATWLRIRPEKDDAHITIVRSTLHEHLSTVIIVNYVSRICIRQNLHSVLVLRGGWEW